MTLTTYILIVDIVARDTIFILYDSDEIFCKIPTLITIIITIIIKMQSFFYTIFIIYSTIFQL